MNLQELIDQYITFRQALGERCKSNGNALRAFGRAIGVTADISEVCVEQVDDFLAGSGPITRAWHVKHSALLGFYQYAVSRGYATSAPLPSVMPKRPPPFVPYIYSREELQRLLSATDSTDSYPRSRSGTEPVTVRTVILLMYGAALRVSEAIALNRADVDLGNLLLTVRRTKFSKTRLVPFGPQLCRVLTEYITRDGAPNTACGAPPLFTTRKGFRINKHVLWDCFRHLRRHAGVQRSDGARYQPRLHDLRHTFAVHRLTSWYQQGLDVQRLLPHLSVYMGHVSLASTQVYLSMTPELLHEANIRFESYAQKDACHV
jgi:site-specific recombinase XerD